MIKTKNFNPDTDPKLLCTCGHPNCDQRSVTQVTLIMVQLIRDDAGRPLKVTSGGRCSFHPREIHRTKPAGHQKGVSIDIYYKTVLERNELMVLAGRHGATAVAFGKSFVHIEWRAVQDARIRTWEY